MASQQKLPEPIRRSIAVIGGKRVRRLVFERRVAGLIDEEQLMPPDERSASART